MTFDAFDHECMAIALRAARRGMFSTAPNPRVGCVLASGGKVLAEGWHQRAGGPHAEPLALQQAGERARGATAYVTLEPCSHQGRTPACAEALVNAGISRVVAAGRDPNPRVNGKGFERLAAAGIQVDVGLLEAQAEALNPGFFQRMRRGRPWVRVKLAMSLDGKTALASGASQWISGAPSRRDVQDWRARSSAILTGIGTVLADDPSLNVRESQTDRQPLRVIVDSEWRTPPGARILSLPGDVLIVGAEDKVIPGSLEATAAELLPLTTDGSGRVDLPTLFAALSDRAMNEVHVEAGATLAGALLDAHLVDELLIYQAPIVLGSDGRDAFKIPAIENMQNRLRLEKIEVVSFGDDIRLRYRPEGGVA